MNVVVVVGGVHVNGGVKFTDNQTHMLDAVVPFWYVRLWLLGGG